MMKRLKGFRLWLTLVVSVFLFVDSAAATIVLFDFEDVPYWSDVGVIETYMEDIYGSDITVTGAGMNTRFFLGPLGYDKYIYASPWLGKSCLSISFDEDPITSVSFDLGMIISSFTAFADGQEILRESWHFWFSDNSGTIYFDSPVTTLQFTDSCIGIIELDNLTVTPVPEPTSLFLLVLGAVMLRKKR
ncbi:MAG: PEP-CTERM sorting domain-containing protein [Planctomycetota bacterium]|jgi:hypothetical protein